MTINIIGLEEIRQKSEAGKVMFSKSYENAGNIAAGATTAEIFITEDDQWQYAPFDIIQITNIASENIQILFDNNPDNALTIKAGVTMAADNQRFRTFAIKNLDAANVISASEVRILVQKSYYEANK